MFVLARCLSRYVGTWTGYTNHGGVGVLLVVMVRQTETIFNELAVFRQGACRKVTPICDGLADVYVLHTLSWIDCWSSNTGRKCAPSTLSNSEDIWQPESTLVILARGHMAFLILGRKKPKRVAKTGPFERN